MMIVKAETSDTTALAAMNHRLIADEGHANPMDVPQLVERMASWLVAEYNCYVVKVDNTAVAYCLYRDDGEQYYMRQLFVERTHRRRGIATKLLDWMYEQVWTDKPVRLEVLSHNDDAMTFYEAYGYRPYCVTLVK